MYRHITIRQPQFCQLLLRRPRHLPIHRTLAMHHLIVRKYKHKIL